MSSCNRDYKATACRKGHSRHSDCGHVIRFIQQLMSRALASIQMLCETAGSSGQTLAREDCCWEAICVMVRFNSLLYLWKESEMFAEEFLCLHRF